MKFQHSLAIAGLVLAAAGTQAATLTEDFEAPFPAWESGWLAGNSNLTNYYGVGAGRGNNPDGLWIGESTIDFNDAFGATVTSIKFDVATWVNGSIQFFDSSNNLLSVQTVTANFGAYTDPGTYESFAVSSTTGIDHFTFTAVSTLGNTSIDNVVVVTNAGVVPEPANVALMLAGLGLVGGLARRRQSRNAA